MGGRDGGRGWDEEEGRRKISEERRNGRREGGRVEIQ